MGAVGVGIIRRICRFLDRTLAVVEVVFGAGTAFGLGVGVLAGPEQTRPLEWGLEGKFIVQHNPALPQTMIGLNVVALATTIYLAKRLYDTSQNSTVISAQQLS